MKTILLILVLSVSSTYSQQKSCAEIAYQKSTPTKIVFKSRELIYHTPTYIVNEVEFEFTSRYYRNTYEWVEIESKDGTEVDLSYLYIERVSLIDDCTVCTYDNRTLSINSYIWFNKELVFEYYDLLGKRVYNLNKNTIYIQRYKNFSRLIYK